MINQMDVHHWVQIKEDGSSIQIASLSPGGYNTESIFLDQIALNIFISESFQFISDGRSVGTIVTCH